MNQFCRKETIRLATPGDACDIALLSRSEIEYGLPWAWRPETVTRAIAQPTMNVAVATCNAYSHNSASGIHGAEHSQHLVGFALVDFGRTHAHINLLAVQKSSRRRGIGRNLLDWQVASARTAGIRYLTLEVRKSNSAALAFYRDCGFELRETVTRYYNNQEDALRLARKLEVEHES